MDWSSAAPPDPDAVVRAVRQAGYQAILLANKTAPVEAGIWSSWQGWRFNIVVGAIALLPLLIGEWYLQLGSFRWFHWLSFALALPVQTWCGARFYRGAWHHLKAGNSNMDTLVALGSTTAFGYSVWALAAGAPTHLYFMESMAIITLISVGHWLESLTSAKAAHALKALLDLAPPAARRMSPDGAVTEVSVAALQPGDLVLLKPGDRAPTDGAVRDGNSAVDESMLTGESLPVDKAPGDTLYAGTVNQNGRLIMRVTATGEATALAHIITVVQRAQTSRANIQKLGDRVSSVFVPGVILIALGAGLWWGLAPEKARQLAQTLAPFLWGVHWPENALAAAIVCAAGVLIVACPCAMGLATPTAIMAGANAAARRGILIRDGVALEKSGRITAVLFDKTGTLTQGKLTVAAAIDFRENHPEILLAPANHNGNRRRKETRFDVRFRGPRPAASAAAHSEERSSRGPSIETLAAALARSSAHPLSRAIAPLSPTPLALTDWQEIRGAGIVARLADTANPWSIARLRLGSLAWLKETGVDLSVATPFIHEWSAQGATLIGLAADKQLLGLLALRDTLKPNALEVINQLQRGGKATYLITGDNSLTAAAIAKQAGIPADHIFAEIRPEQKALIIQQLQQAGQRVAFVGDGINDAPALGQADLGIAVSQASDVAREAADIILLKSDLRAIPEALGLAQATLRTIKQNLFWAFFYNAAAVPLAALGFLSPVLCAAAMSLSDLIVIGNALRLRWWKPQ